MNDQVWYVYQQKQQQGPYAPSQIKQFLSDNMIAQDAFLFKVGWEKWRPISECLQELGLIPPVPPSPLQEEMASEDSPKGRQSQRTTISGRVIVHNNGQIVIGSGVNISETGIFVETKEQLFKLGEILRLTCKVEGMAGPFNAKATVIRFNTDPAYALGYGLQFNELDTTVSKQIKNLILHKAQAQKTG